MISLTKYRDQHLKSEAHLFNSSKSKQGKWLQVVQGAFFSHALWPQTLFQCQGHIEKLMIGVVLFTRMEGIVRSILPTLPQFRGPNSIKECKTTLPSLQQGNNRLI